MPCIMYMFALGPPRSLRFPRKSGIFVIFSTSRRMLSLERLMMNLPWCADMVQKAHPPKHPLCMFTENFIMSYAGMRFPLYLGCGIRV